MGAPAGEVSRKRNIPPSILWTGESRQSDPAWARIRWCGPRLPHRTDGAGASRLVDVRLNPVSRVRGFSKNRLRERLEASGLVYEHRPELGNPKNNRAGYAEPGTLAAHRAHARFRDSVLSTPSADSALAYLAGLVAADPRICTGTTPSGEVASGAAPSGVRAPVSGAHPAAADGSSQPASGSSPRAA